MEAMKKFASVLMVVLILTLSVFNNYVYADDPEEQITEYTINLIYNNQNIPKESYQTLDNYNAYYDLLSGNLKNDIIFGGFSETQYNSNQFEAFYNSINYIGNNEYLDFNELTFKAITVDDNVINFNDCFYFLSLKSDTSNNYLNLYLVYSPTSNDEIYISGDQMCAEHIFYYSLNRYKMIINNIDGVYYSSYQLLSSGQYNATDTRVGVVPAPDGLLDLYHIFNLGGIILSNKPFYYLWNGQNDTSNNDYTNMGFSNPYYVYWHLMQGDDTTGFLTDRRIYVGNNSSEDGVIRDEINPEDFNGNLGFKSFYPQSSLNLDKVSGRHLAPFTFIKYQPNNYTRLKAPERVIVKYECQFYCYVKLKNGFFQKWNFYATLDYPLTDAPEELYLNYDIFNQSNPRYQDNYKNDLDINDQQYTNSQDYTYVIDYWWMRQPKYDDDISVVPSDYKVSEMQIFFNTECYLYDSVTGETSKRTTFKLDVLNEKTTFDDGAIDDDDDEYTKFITDHDFDNDDKPVIYVPTVNPVITDDRDISIVVNDNPFPYILVDIPEDQYIDTTPRFGAMMKDIVSAVGEDRNQSIVTLVKQEYDYLPEQATKYITYAVGVICLVGFWKMIRK